MVQFKQQRLHRSWYAAGIAQGQGTVSNSLCSLLCLPAPFKRLVCDLESQAYGREVFLDLLSQIGSDYSARPPTVSELWLLFRQVAAIAFCITRRRKPICPVEKIVNVLRTSLGMLCPFRGTKLILFYYMFFSLALARHRLRARRLPC